MTEPAATGFAVWLTGLPSSGKTSLAWTLQGRLARRGLRAIVLDSDQLRSALTPHPTYSEQERDQFYRTLTSLAAMLTGQGFNVLIAATAPKRRHRGAARAMIGRFAEVYLECPPEVCRQRDPKGLWARADRGEINSLPGAGAAYEEPEAPEARVNTAAASVERAAEDILGQLDKRGFFTPPLSLEERDDH